MSDTRARINNYEIYSIDGDVAVDFVGRFENLGGGSEARARQVGLMPRSADLPRAKTTFRKRPCPIATIMTTTRSGIVGDWYAREIELLDYEF